MPTGTWTRVVLLGGLLGLPVLSGCRQEQDVTGTPPPQIKPLIPAADSADKGENDAGAGSTTTGGKH